MKAVVPGIQGESMRIVEPEIAVDFMGREEARVLGTPFLIYLLEITARNSVQDLLEPGWDTVGTDVSVKHLAATPLGMRVTFRSEVLDVNGRRILFKVEAFDEREKIAEGTHERVAIQVQRFAEKLIQKRGG